jgi:hypothetical protein
MKTWSEWKVKVGVEEVAEEGRRCYSQDLQLGDVLLFSCVRSQLVSGNDSFQYVSRATLLEHESFSFSATAPGSCPATARAVDHSGCGGERSAGVRSTV